MKLQALRHNLQDQDQDRAGLAADPLPDPVVEADECFVQAGKSGIPDRGPDDPPRCRANKRRGHGTFDDDRPPVAATVGRESGRACLHVVEHPDRVTLGAVVQATMVPGSMLNADEWHAQGRVPELGRGHLTVNHGAREWARDDDDDDDGDGDGVRVVHANTMEGTWTGLRNFLRPFRGVSK